MAPHDGERFRAIKATEAEGIYAAIYIRVSTRHQAEEGFSLEDQRDKLVAYANQRDWTFEVRSFQPEDPKSRQFTCALSSIEEVISLLRSQAADGLYTIVNETIDVSDGGVSGVVLGGVAEFAPDDTPRCVEKPGVARFEHSTAARLLTKVYGFEPELDYKRHERVEFSLHPLRAGFRQTHTIVWEIEEVDEVDLAAQIEWPNRFSRMMGDKAFGLLVADTLGLPVPHTMVVGRRLAPFELGERTGTGEIWLRTCPTEQVPGHFTTSRGWEDPFTLLQNEDPKATALASVLAQEGVDARFSGATLPQEGQPDLVEGVAGTGEAFMKGRDAPISLPKAVEADVRSLLAAAHELGPVRLEWVHDSWRAWVVQLHLAGERLSSGVIYPGEPQRWHTFQAQDGLGELRALIAKINGDAEGILVHGNVGITSHVGDLLRKARIPSRLATSANS